ncbi:MAG: hypothetical protein N3F65_04975 [Nitrososphaeria archaeon]|nr:hypothetical protein [Nitrososphaeria archaeon]
MSHGGEADILKEIEEEVKILLGEKRNIRLGKAVIYYFSLKQDSELGNILEAMRKGDVVLVSFEGSDLENIKEKISMLARKLGEADGEIYFIKWPTLLLVKRNNVELKVHHG